MSIENDWFNTRAWVVNAERPIFSGMERSSEKNSDLRSQFDCGSGRDGVKGQDERQSTAPLTPSRPPEGDSARKLKNTLDRDRHCHTWGTRRLAGSILRYGIGTIGYGAGRWAVGAFSLPGAVGEFTFRRHLGHPPQEELFSSTQDPAFLLIVHRFSISRHFRQIVSCYCTSLI